jgi:uncharacterized protein YciI
MKQYVIIAYDGLDAEASERRKKIRPFHLEGAKLLKDKNQFITGGAILNDDGQMTGSVMIVQFETEEDFQEWYKNEPYITEGVWQNIEVKPFRVAVVQ